ncbi:MAG: class II glutamine amidotransferase [Deltaproteobacteria bacterium]|nr:class II glutamine amidotransferase [Deltaproteobacteria bacterium]
MPNLLAMSFEGELAPSFDLRCLHDGAAAPDGWGIGYYPGGEPSAAVLKEPAPPPGSMRSELVKAWEHLETSLFVVHIRSATWGAVSDANTQPFHRAWGGRDWLFAHSGSLVQRPTPRPGGPFEPVGSTDTELVFCELMNRFAERGWRSLAEADLEVVRGWLQAFDELGNLTSVLADGHDLCVYAGRSGSRIFLCEVLPPYERFALGDRDLEVDLCRRGVKARKGVVVSSSPLEIDGEPAADRWQAVPPGHLVVVRQGAVRAEVAPAGVSASQLALPGTRRVVMARPRKAEVRRFEVTHRTSYRYERPVEQSTHLFRLAPVHDRLQTLLSHEMTVTVDGQWREYEDVFGNRTRRLHVETPFTEMVIEARSRVELLDTDPLSYKPLRARTEIPVVWMPWQRQVLQPFLLPRELPESELEELSDYAMSFAVRNDYDILDTLLDINGTIYREYKYTPGATTMATTPFDIYANRRGVCQDFTNLFQLLAQLLGLPARYVCGYVYTGPRHENQRQAEASHAWAQVYLPEVGWKGFDPTNGILTQTEHIRVAVGRNHRDATPTGGTIYVGGAGETLEVSVRVEPMP